MNVSRCEEQQMKRNTNTIWKLSLLITSGAALLLSLTACGSSNSNTSGGSGPVGLGAAGDFVILAKTAITTVPTSGRHRERRDQPRGRLFHHRASR